MIEYFFARVDALRQYLANVQQSSASITSKPSIESLMTTVLDYFVEMCFVVNCAKVTYLTIANIDLGQGRCPWLALSLQ